MLHRNPKNAKLLTRGAGEPWLGVQVLGAKPELLAEAARILNDLTMTFSTSTWAARTQDHQARLRCALGRDRTGR